MTSAIGLLDGNDLSEHLTKLFPKCRPRDLNLNHLNRPSHENTIVASQSLDNNPYIMEIRKEISRINDEQDELGQEEDDNESAESGCSSSDDQGNNDDFERHGSPEGQVIVLHSNKGATYKLRDSRIIEIAGGRELFSASRSKILRKPSKTANHSLGEPRSSFQAGSGGTRELTETVFSTEVHSVKLQRDVGGAVVFDDIEEPSNPWKRRNDPESAGSSPSPPSYHQTPSDFFQQVTSSLLNVEKEGQVRSKGIKMIGGIAIAEYEGSPRRYGPRVVDRDGSARPSLPSARSLLASPSVGNSRSECIEGDVPSSPHRSSPTLESKSLDQPTCSAAFDYLYEFSETRKVLEEFFKQSSSDCTKVDCQDFDELGYELRRQASKGSAYVGLRLAKNLAQQDTNKTDPTFNRLESEAADLSLDSASTEDLGDTEVGLQVGQSRNFTLSPETTDCESNCGDLDSEASLLMENETQQSTAIDASVGIGGVPQTDSLRLYSAMPVLEDGLSSGHASDTDNNNSSVVAKRQLLESVHRSPVPKVQHMSNGANLISELRAMESDLETASVNPLNTQESCSPPPPAPAPHRLPADTVEATLKDIRQTLQRTKALPGNSGSSNSPSSPIWIPRRHKDEPNSKRPRPGGDVPEEEEADTDLETDRLLGQQRTDDNGFFEEKNGWKKPKSRTVISGGGLLGTTPPNDAPDTSPTSLNNPAPSKPKKERDSGKKKGRNKEVVIHDPSVLIEGVLFRARYLGSTQLVCEGQPTKSTRMMQAEEAVSRIKAEVTNPLIGEGARVPSPATLLPVTVFRLQFLGSLEIEEETGRRNRKKSKKSMVEEAVKKIKAPEGETQPSTEVDLFISTEKIMVLNTDLKEIMMDHALRTISYIADIGELVVLMARRRYVPHDVDDSGKFGRTPKMICHVFESEEAQFIAQSIGQAFQVAYMEFLKANGIEDHSFVKEMDYQEVLNSQEIFGDELQMFAKKEMQKEVVVPKAKGEMLGVVIVESGWGSMLPTVVIANLAPAGAAARCGHLNIGDQIIAINGISLVGLPLSTCQTYIKNSKNQTVVKLTVVPCAPVVEVKIKRPDTKYQLGFSVQNGVICSLLRGGIAERGGVRVGHRIIEINNQSVVAVPHEKIVNLLATSVGEILMKTMPTSMFRLLTGQETPLYI